MVQRHCGPAFGNRPAKRPVAARGAHGARPGVFALLCPRAARQRSGHRRALAFSGAKRQAVGAAAPLR